MLLILRPAPEPQLSPFGLSSRHFLAQISPKRGIQAHVEMVGACRDRRRPIWRGSRQPAVFSGRQ